MMEVEKEKETTMDDDGRDGVAVPDEGVGLDPEASWVRGGEEMLEEEEGGVVVDITGMDDGGGEMCMDDWKEGPVVAAPSEVATKDDGDASVGSVVAAAPSDEDEDWDKNGPLRNDNVEEDKIMQNWKRSKFLKNL